MRLLWLSGLLFLKPFFVSLSTQESCGVGKVGEWGVSGNEDMFVILPPEEKGWMRGKM